MISVVKMIMCSGLFGLRVLVIFCSYVVELVWLDYIVRVVGNVRMLEVKMVGIMFVMFSFSGRNEVWFMYVLWLFC